MIIKGNRRIAGGGRKYSLPLTVVAAVIGTYLVTSNFEALSAQHNNLRQTATASSNALLGMVVPQGRAVALPSVRISAKESGKIDRKIYGGEGGEFIENLPTYFSQLGICDGDGFSYAYISSLS